MSHNKTKGSPYLIQEDNSDTKGSEKKVIQLRDSALLGF